jgi:integrase/recombinase XerC
MDSICRLRHTFAAELANSEVSVYTLIKLLGQESMVTSPALCHCRRQRNPYHCGPDKLYDLLADESLEQTARCREALRS